MEGNLPHPLAVEGNLPHHQPAVDKEGNLQLPGEGRQVEGNLQPGVEDMREGNPRAEGGMVGSPGGWGSPLLPNPPGVALDMATPLAA